MLERKKTKIFIIIFILILIVSGLGLCVFFLRKGKDTNILEKRVDSYIEYGNSVVPIENGYVIVGSNNHNNSNLEKANISFYDSNQQKTLEKIYNKGYNSTFYDVVRDDDGFVAVGDFESSKDDHNNGYRTALIVKYDKLGEIVFENDIQIKSDSKYTSVIKVSDGYIVCGKSINTSVEEGTSGAVLIKYNKDGEEVWRRYAGGINAVYNDLIEKDGCIYAVGVDKNIGILSKYDINGSLINNIYYANLDDKGFTSILNLENTLYISCGKLVDDKSYGAIIAYDLDGNYINEVTYQEVSNTYKKLMVDDTNSIIAIGEAIVMEDSTYITEGIIGKYTDSLKEMSVVQHSSNREVTFNDMFIDNGKYAVVGNSKVKEENINTKLFIFSSALKNIS